jgi:hypothetical protein
MASKPVTATMRHHRLPPPASRPSKAASGDKVPFDKLSPAQVGSLDSFGVQPDILRKVCCIQLCRSLHLHQQRSPKKAYLMFEGHLFMNNF